MSGINQVWISGHIGQDPEVRQTASGKSVVTLSIATSHQEQTSWHRVVAWQQNADFAGKYLRKGDLVNIIGRVDYRKYTHRDGSERTSTEIVAHTLQAVGGKDRGSERNTETPPRDYPEPDGNKAEAGFDDIPF
jgi:single-strand DNA-binding protein